jgi:hypothetical protein
MTRDEKRYKIDLFMIVSFILGTGHMTRGEKSYKIDLFMMVPFNFGVVKSIWSPFLLGACCNIFPLKLLCFKHSNKNPANFTTSLLKIQIQDQPILVSKYLALNS